MPEQPTEEVRGGVEDKDVLVQQPDIDAAVARATGVALEELRVGSRRPLNAGAQTVAFPGSRKAAKGAAEIGGVKVAVSITIVADKDRDDDDLNDEVRYIDDTGTPKAADRKDYEDAVKQERVQGVEVSKSKK